MQEKQLANTFNAIFNSYPIHTITSKAGGLPDKGIQLKGSKIIWFELKVVEAAKMMSRANQISLNNLSDTQAAWLSGWKRNEGHCYLFLGVLSNKTKQYGVLNCDNWRDWLKIPKENYPLSKLELLTNDTTDVLSWFRDKHDTPTPFRSVHKGLLADTISTDSCGACSPNVP